MGIKDFEDNLKKYKRNELDIRSIKDFIAENKRSTYRGRDIHIKNMKDIVGYPKVIASDSCAIEHIDKTITFGLNYEDTSYIYEYVEKVVAERLEKLVQENKMIDDTYKRLLEGED